jgi:hypothetical protein
LIPLPSGYEHTVVVHHLETMVFAILLDPTIELVNAVIAAGG